MNSFQKLMVLRLALLLVLMSASVTAQDVTEIPHALRDALPEPSVVLAEVNGKKITGAEVRARMLSAPQPEQLAPRALEAYVQECVDRVLIEDFLKKRRVEIEDEIVDARTKAVLARASKAAGSEEAALDRLGHDEESLRRTVRLSLTWLKHAQQTLVDKQYRDYFKEHQMQLDGTRVVLTYKFIKLSDNATDGETERAASQLKAAITEGDLGERVTTEFAGKLPRPVTAEAFSINIGETSDIIFTPQAAYVIRVHERIPGQLSLEDVRTQVLSVLAQQLWDEEVARQRSNARIRVTLP
ncbi:MAG: peptidyl-prolyl cis-trans isomerase [Planctomycetaceae bacterium]|nr:peptidyl-prolyl cis-trans isomerase [Planctomycetaceae bacterium]